MTEMPKPASRFCLLWPCSIRYRFHECIGTKFGKYLKRTVLRPDPWLSVGHMPAKGEDEQEAARVLYVAAMHRLVIGVGEGMGEDGLCDRLKVLPCLCEIATAEKLHTIVPIVHSPTSIDRTIFKEKEQTCNLYQPWG